MKFTNYKCPVCENTFTEEDDVVVCPDCGTPHHRQCYTENGKCFNARKHETNEPVEVEFTDVKDEGKTEDKTEENIPSEEKENNDTREVIREIINEITDNPKDISLNGKHISFYEAAIGKNQKYYIPRFMLIDKIKKGTSWNIAAFFVPLAWCVYRKMYKIAAIILALYVLVVGSVSFSILGNEELINTMVECAEEDPDFAAKVLLYDTDSYDITLTPKQMEFYKLSQEIEIPTVVTVLNYVVSFGVRMIMGIYATNLYYKKLTKSIEKVEKTTLSPDMQRSYLFRKCGTFPLIIAVIIGFFEWQMF